MRSLSRKKDQTAFVVLGVIKYSLKTLYPKICLNKQLVVYLTEALKYMLDIIKSKGSNSFFILKENILKSLEVKNWEDVSHLISSYECGPDELVLEKKNKKNVSIVESSDTEASTKIDNKLEITCKEVVGSSIRNFQTPSPMNNMIKMDTSSNLKILQGDNSFKWGMVNKQRLPYLTLAVDISLSGTQINKYFINEMKKLKLHIIGDEKSDILFVEKKNKGLFRNLICDCFHFNKKQETSKLSFTTKFSDNKCERILDIRCLSGVKIIKFNLIIFLIILEKRKFRKYFNTICKKLH